MGLKGVNIRIRIFAFFSIVCTVLFITVRLLTILLEDNKDYKQYDKEDITTIPARRGDILSRNGEILSSTIYKYDLSLDVTQIDKETFYKWVESAADTLAVLFPTYSSAHYSELLRDAYKNKRQHIDIDKSTSQKQLHALNTHPFFKKRKHRISPIKSTEIIQRLFTYGEVARRTLGDYYARSYKDVGIEGAYDVQLKGKDGERVARKITRSLDKPTEYTPIRDVQHGADVITTLDMDIQTMADNALRTQLHKFNAQYGGAIVMDVNGAIRAMSNLHRNHDGTYREGKNYAVQNLVDIGSVAKSMSYIALLEDGYASPSTSISTHPGSVHLYDKDFEDDHNYGTVTLDEALAYSSNVAFIKLFHKYYAPRPMKYIDRLYSMGIGSETQVGLYGETPPTIPTTKDSTWSRLSILQISRGYEIQMTPLQIASFYNAIANGGVYTPPYLVEAVRYSDGTQVSQKPSPEKQRILCSRSTANALKNALEKVVKEGTAKGIYMPALPIAGKTSTAQVEYWMKDKVQQYGSMFVGYFPADEPKFTALVYIYKPDIRQGYYGAKVSAPVVRRIAQSLVHHFPHREMIDTTASYQQLVDLYQKRKDALRKKQNRLPDFKHIPLSDALAWLESHHIRVQYQGVGNVMEQWPKAGTNLQSVNVVSLSVR